MRNYVTKSYPLVIDFLDYTTNRNATSKIVFNQKDTNTGFIIAELKANKEIVEIADETRVIVAIKKSDGYTVQNSCSVLDPKNGIIEVPFSTQSLISQGINYFEIVIINGDTELVSPRFSFRVDESIIDDDTIESSNEFGILMDLIIEVKAMEDRVEKLESDIKKAENIRKTNENTRIANENTRIANENTRKQNETSRETSEALREQQEATRRSNEQTRVSQENTRKQNESSRQTAENNRSEQEAARQTEENTRKQNESSRQTAEGNRNKEEVVRQTNEDDRENNEIVRLEQEEVRQSNEELRVNQEQGRIDKMNSLVDVVENHYINRLAGGYIHVNTKNELLYLERPKLKQGMLCHVRDEDIIYQLKQVAPPNWSQLSLSGSGEGGSFKIVQSESQKDNLGGLQNGTLCYVIDSDEYYKYKDGLWEVFKSGSGGGGNSIVTLSTEMNTTLQVATNQELILTLNYESTTKKSGKLILEVNGVQKLLSKVDIGKNRIDVSKFLSKGINEVYIEVTDIYGSKDFLVFNIDVVELELTSTFNYINIFDGSIEFNYIAKGNVSKTIHFLVDGIEVGTEVVTTTGIQKLYSIPKQTHGSHKIEVYATANVGEKNITSNRLMYEVICIEKGNINPIIASNFNQTDAEQYSIISIPYLVYTPNSLQSNVTLKINNVIKGSVIADRTEQRWSTTDYPTGRTTFTITTGNVTRNFVVNVTEVDIDIEEETENLDLHLTSLNRSNSDINKDVWEDNGVRAILNNFNWKTNGWVEGQDGVPVLRIKDGANIEIPFKPFENDFKLMGKTIEFEFLVTDVLNYNATIVNCMSGNRGLSITPKEAIFKTNEIEIKTQFKDNERIRISFVVEDIGKNRLIYTYVNGIISGLNRYVQSDIFVQNDPINIFLGSNECTLDIYNIRVYSRGIDSNGVLNNFIYDMSDVSKKISLFNSNRIYDSYGEILYSKILDQIPCMTITGSLPSVKGDKKKVSIKYENKTEPIRDFTDSSATLDIQGTSSQYYPKKNYKFKLNKKYKLRENSIEENVFCIKADYMESSHSHNTGMAKIVHNIYSEKVPPQLLDDRVRTTIDGFPIAVFYKENENSQPKYFGVYNFNNDKDDVDTFGYIGEGVESWEICNNTSDRCLFNKSEYDLIDPSSGKPEWQLDFEARYPEDYTDYTNLKRLTDWIASVQSVNFKNEVGQYFNIHYLLTYYLITEFFGMVDSRAKNMFLSTWDGHIWYPVFYDMDTMLGLNNEGVNEFNYNIEDSDVIGSQNVFNGKNSRLWELVKGAFATEIKQLYNKMRDDDKLTYEKVLDILIGEQIGLICESQYNADAQYKYLDPLINENIATYLYVAQGSRINHIKYWLFNRFKYMDSKYIASDYKSNYATLRLYTPSSWSGVKPNANFNIVPFNNQYVGVKFGSYERFVRANANEVTTVESPDIVFNDTETIIYGADNILSLGDLSDKYAGTVDVSKAIKLKELILGSSVEGYKNTNLHIVSVGNNELLRKIDITNCPNVSNVLDLSGCPSLEEVHAKGTNITSVTLSSRGSNLKKMHLPSSIANLQIKDKPNLTELTLEGYDKINTLYIENVGINPLSLLGNCKNIELVRFMNLNCKTTVKLMNILKNCKGMDERGLEVPIGEAVSGRVVLNKATLEMVEEYKSIFPYVEFSVEIISKIYTVTFVDGDGKVLYVEKVLENDEATYIGEIPTKQPTAQFEYEFEGWDSPLKPIIANVTIAATFKRILRYYNITFMNPDTGEVLDIQYLPYGSTPVAPDLPSGYNMWNPLISTVVGEQIYECEYVPYPEDLSIFSFSSETIDGISGYRCTLRSGSTTPAMLIIPFEYNGKLVLSYYGNSESSSFKANTTEVYIPKSIKTIGSSAFRNFTSLRSITIPDGVTSLMASCFNNCTSLIEINLPNSLTSIGATCFDGCTSLINMIIPNGVTSLGTDCFNNCTSLIEINLPNSLTSISAYCFSGCESLISIIIPNNITSLGSYTFRNCDSLTSVVLPNGVTSLGSGCFMSCDSLIEINLPNSLTSIGATCFNGCTSLTNMIIPNGVTSIGDSCFSYAPLLKNVQVGNVGYPVVSTSGWGKTIFGSDLSSLIIYTSTGTSSGLSGSPWGASKATITYKKA